MVVLVYVIHQQVSFIKSEEAEEVKIMEAEKDNGQNFTTDNIAMFSVGALYSLYFHIYCRALCDFPSLFSR